MRADLPLANARGLSERLVSRPAAGLGCGSGLGCGLGVTGGGAGGVTGTAGVVTLTSSMNQPRPGCDLSEAKRKR
jgi:hypothetical protein